MSTIDASASGPVGTDTPADAAFALRGDPDDTKKLVGPKEMGRLIAEARGRPEPYHPESVRNWVKQGRLSPAGSDKRGNLFDPDDAAAIAQTLPEPSHGGQRTGAGRKPDAPRPQPLTDAAETAAQAREDLERYRSEEAAVDAGEMDPGASSRSRMTLHDLVGLSPEQWRVYLNSPYNTGSAELTDAKLARYERLLKIRSMERKQDLENGKLVRIDDIERAYATAIAPVARTIDGLPASVAEAVSESAWIQRETIGYICSILDNEDTPREVIDEIRKLLTPPNGYKHRIARIIERDIEKARAALNGIVASDR